MTPILTNGDARYFKWLTSGVDEYANESYSKCLTALYYYPFDHSIPMDANRVGDGLELRQEFVGYMESVGEYVEPPIALEDATVGTCSMLELMIAMARRCETEIMADSEIGDRTGFWFWIMADTLFGDLSEFSDSAFDYSRFEHVMQKFMARTYRKNGMGSLFRTNTNVDMRQLQLWSQLNVFLNEFVYHQ